MREVEARPGGRAPLRGELPALRPIACLAGRMAPSPRIMRPFAAVPRTEVWVAKGHCGKREHSH